MKEILIYVGLAALGTFVLYLIVKSIVENIKYEQFRNKNRESQFSGCAAKEEKGCWASLFTPKYSSRAETIGDYGEKRVSSFLEDLDCEEYKVYNDLLIRKKYRLHRLLHRRYNLYNVMDHLRHSPHTLVTSSELKPSGMGAVNESQTDCIPRQLINSSSRYLGRGQVALSTNSSSLSTGLRMA